MNDDDMNITRYQDFSLLSWVSQGILFGGESVFGIWGPKGEEGVQMGFFKKHVLSEY